MKSKSILLIVPLAVCLVVLITWKKSSKPQEAFSSSQTVEIATIEDSEPSPAEEIEAAVEDITEPVPATFTTATAEQPAQSPLPPTASPPAVQESQNQIVFRGERFPVKSDVVLARVNFVDITLKSLQPVSETAPSEIIVSAVDFKHNLERAIDREVILDTARRSNIQLDEEQKRWVEKSRLSAGAKGFSLPDDERPDFEAKSNFESLDLLSNLLGDGIAKASGGPAKDIVSEEEYQKYIRNMLDDLRKRNSIKVFAVIETD